MNQITLQKQQQLQQHLLETTQASKVPVEKVSKSLEKSQYTADDLLGLSWTLFEWEDD